LMLMTSCSEEKKADNPGGESKVDAFLPPGGLPDPLGGPLGEGVPPPAVVASALTWDVVALMVRTNPRHPEDEQYLDAWRVGARNIDDNAQIIGPTIWGNGGPDGNFALGLPGYMLSLPLEVVAFNEAAPPINHHKHRHHRDHRRGDRDEEGENGE